MEIMIPVWSEVAEAQVAKRDLTVAKGAARPLEGVSVALVDDNYDAVFTAEVEARLRDDHGADVKRFLKPSGSAPSPKALIDEAARCRVAVVGIAL